MDIVAVANNYLKMPRSMIVQRKSPSCVCVAQLTMPIMARKLRAGKCGLKPERDKCVPSNAESRTRGQSAAMKMVLTIWAGIARLLQGRMIAVDVPWAPPYALPVLGLDLTIGYGYSLPAPEKVKCNLTRSQHCCPAHQ